MKGNRTRGKRRLWLIRRPCRSKSLCHPPRSRVRKSGFPERRRPWECRLHLDHALKYRESLRRLDRSLPLVETFRCRALRLQWVERGPPFRCPAPHLVKRFHQRPAHVRRCHRGPDRMSRRLNLNSIRRLRRRHPRILSTRRVRRCRQRRPSTGSRRPSHFRPLPRLRNHRRRSLKPNR